MTEKSDPLGLQPWVRVRRANMYRDGAKELRRMAAFARWQDEKQVASTFATMALECDEMVKRWETLGPSVSAECVHNRVRITCPECSGEGEEPLR